MSVLIKDFDVPDMCIECPFYSHDVSGCLLASNGCVDRYNFDVTVRQEWCPLTDVKDLKAEPVSVRFVSKDEGTLSPCANCQNRPRNGEIKVCNCILAAPKIMC